ncbi:MAG: DUF1990 domain-containing protein [Acidimicrobiia bacterium]|nr:DUF1990 domain-containing protein [Acidimicrobiia bacterium]
MVKPIAWGSFGLGAPDLAATHAEQARAEPTYDASLRGATVHGEALPDGWSHHRLVRALGEGEDVFARAATGVRAWEAHRGAGVDVHPGDPPALGATVVQRIALGPATVLACCRVVAVVDEPRRSGFAYGTLPLHPERGEESFVVALDDDGTVRFRVVAFSRFAHPLTRLGAPVTRRVQSATMHRYLDALEAWVADGSG